MVTVGAVLMILGFLFGVPMLWSIGLLVLVIGLICMLLGSLGHAVFGRRHYF